MLKFTINKKDYHAPIIIFEPNDNRPESKTLLTNFRKSINNNIFISFKPNDLDGDYARIRTAFQCYANEGNIDELNNAVSKMTTDNEELGNIQEKIREIRLQCRL